MTEKNKKTQKKGKTKSVNNKYYETLEKIVFEYITSNKEESQRCDIIKHLADNELVHKERKRGNYKISENENDTELYDRVADQTLQRLIEKDKVKKIYYGPKKTRYVAKVPTFTSLYNTDIVIIQVEPGEEKRAKTLIDGNLEDKSIIIIPVEGFLLCTKMNSRKRTETESQSTYIRKCVHRAIRKANCQLYSKK